MCINIIGNTIEGNKQCGIYHRYRAEGLNIAFNYFETNGITGKTFSDPVITLKADIIINGNALPPDISGPNDDVKRTYPVQSLKVENNNTSSDTKDYFIYAFAFKGAKIDGNVCGSGSPVLFGTYSKRSYSDTNTVEIGKHNINFPSLLYFNEADYFSLRLSTGQSQVLKLRTISL